MPHEIHPDRIAFDARSALDEIRRLQADRAHRDARRRFFVEDARNVVHAIEGGFHIEALVYSEKLLIVTVARRLVRDRCRSGTPTLHCRAIGASPDGSADLHRFDYPRPTILVLGEERRGLAPLQRDLCSDLVRIPMVGAADSLNLAVAGSLLLYEVYRARSVRRGRSP
jgi:tRNA G18 (ribose-2'-O)-methylase SpoU